ncbi:unnamed protein product [Dibothriocephalus latus]|uniref:Uncharacterized protein n=1 Tax=Dibothriocephalus latus TaxID=60516 RepID=A0A3P7LG47_DIBLA|nr:unnamed protein product [Dibothriocephalus latus]
MHDLRNTYPELYSFMLQTGNKIESPESSTKNSDSSWTNTAFAKVEASFESDSDVAFAQFFGIHDSSNSLLTIRRAMSSIFNCLNAVHVQKTSKLRMEIRDLCCRLQGLQASREQDQHEIYRLQRERDRFRRELAHQAARYEDRITELHSVLAELKRKMERPNAVVDVGMAVQDLVEVSDDDDVGDVDHEDVEDDVNDDQVDGGNTGKQDQQKEQNASRNHLPLLSDWENNGVAAAVDSFGSLVEFSYSTLIANGANMAGGLIHSEPEDLMTSHNSIASGNASLEAQSCLAQSSIIDGNDHATKSLHNWLYSRLFVSEHNEISEFLHSVVVTWQRFVVKIFGHRQCVRVSHRIVRPDSAIGNYCGASEADKKMCVCASSLIIAAVVTASNPINLVTSYRGPQRK